MSGDLMEKGEAGDFSTSRSSKTSTGKERLNRHEKSRTKVELPEGGVVSNEPIRKGLLDTAAPSCMNAGFRIFQNFTEWASVFRDKSQTVSRTSDVRACKLLNHHKPNFCLNISFIVDNCPEGYPRLAAFLDSDENFMLYRRFGFLQTRLLLNKQAELREYEKELDRLDQETKTNAQVD